MSESLLSEYKKKMNRRGSSPYERSLKHKQREFIDYFSNTLNREQCLINGQEALAVFQDHSQSNNKDLSDDKYVILPNETRCGVGDYISWREGDWLVFTEEEKTIPTHQQLKIKVVNESIKWLIDGKVSGSGNGWGAYVQNQTLYTLGVAFTGNHVSVVDAKMMMYMQNSEETRRLKVQDRIFIGNQVYSIMFMDTVSRKGLINYLLEQDTINEYDNKDLRIADYYKTVDEKEEIPEETPDISIEGEDKLKIGRTYVFKTSKESVVEEWIIDSMNQANPPFYIEEKSDSLITLKVKNDQRIVGDIVNILAKTKDKQVISKSAKIIQRF